MAAAVWSAPRVDGLTIRPNYASALSAPLSADPGGVDGFQVISPAFGRACNNANLELYPGSLPGVTFQHR